ncbi:hypothetical protein [Flammeovirga sp. EKP202]|uniref:hypothetical protein n=1 Tax=Flammeovirga sp. EKP202 TaxID=2770592 RepID=UPI00165ED661|nr:hypothetical protein [Flammeovirga sp. EKP202]MBD0402648.1 hypothetical protein [Flammeovirga sp. EKP202]
MKTKLISIIIVAALTSCATTASLISGANYRNVKLNQTDENFDMKFKSFSGKDNFRMNCSEGTKALMLKSSHSKGEFNIVIKNEKGQVIEQTDNSKYVEHKINLNGTKQLQIEIQGKESSGNLNCSCI